MDPRLQSANNLEKSGAYQEALQAYLRIEAEVASGTEPLSDENALFLRRSIAACFFYTKDYREAQKRFKLILADDSLGSREADEVQTCLYLCWLYGGSPERARKAFVRRIAAGSRGKRNKTGRAAYSKSWDYWYAGQCCYLLGEYNEMADFYEDAVHCAEQADSDKVVFFLSHLVVAELLAGLTDDAGRILNKLSFMEDTSCGLLKIGDAIYRKTRGAADWEAEFSDGLKEAERSGYNENKELGEFLLKKFS